MKIKDKKLYACKNDDCGIVIGCENIFTKGGMPCIQCKVKDNCNMRAVPLKYANTFTIERTSLCDFCYEKARRIRHEKDKERFGG